MGADPGVRLDRIDSAEAWREALAQLPSPHLLQTSAWAEFKAAYGWSPERLVWRGPAGEARAAAQVLIRHWPRRSPGRLSLRYCPRGPTLDWNDRSLAERVLRDLAALAGRPGCVAVKLEPDAEAGDGLERTLTSTGWTPSAQPVQFSSTMVLDLRPDEASLLAAMKPKTRYNIRLAARRGVTVRPGTPADFEALYSLYAETSVRDGFVIRPPAYYRRAWGDFVARGMAQPFLAEVDGQPVAGLILFHHAGRAWFFYGMSGPVHRERMPNHALQWEAIRWARAAGCHTYDLWGAAEATDPDDPLSGVQRFKEGFGARHVRLAGSWERSRRPLLFWIYAAGLPRILGWTRRLQLNRTRRMLEPGDG